MNCHRARQLISPYLDQRLTGREMLALQDHFALCASCEAERRSIRQVKLLLRALHEPRPSSDLSRVIAGRLAETERPLWQVVTLSPPRPQRGRRLVTALALSCLTVLSFAASLAPASRDGAFTSSGFLLPMGAGQVGTMTASDMSLSPPAPTTGFLITADAAGSRHGKSSVSLYPAAPPTDLRLSPLPDAVSPGSFQGAATFAAYRTR